jgi:hypothetical protein
LTEVSGKTETSMMSKSMLALPGMTVLFATRAATPPRKLA